MKKNEVISTLATGINPYLTILNGTIQWHNGKVRKMNYIKRGINLFLFIYA